jgi:hypothetical protein
MGLLWPPAQTELEFADSHETNKQPKKAKNNHTHSGTKMEDKEEFLLFIHYSMINLHLFI